MFICFYDEARMVLYLKDNKIVNVEINELVSLEDNS